MSTENDDHDGGEWDDPSDLTRLEDLSEFLHEEDPEVEAKLKAASVDQDLPDLPSSGEDLMGLDDLEDGGESDDGDDQESFGSESSSFSEEATNPGFDTNDLSEDFSENSSEEEQDFSSDDSSFDSSTDFSNDYNENDGDSFSSEEDTSFSSEDDNEQSFGEDQFASGDDSEDNFENELNEEEDAQFSEADDLNNDDSNDFNDDGDSDENFDGGEQDTNWDETTDDDQEASFNSDSDDDDSFAKEEENDFANDDGNEGGSNFELPDPEEINDRPPIESAVPEAHAVSTAGPRENFQDLRDFGNAITYGVVTTGGNPPFSLILRNIKFEEDAEDIKILLREHGLVSGDNEETITQGLQQGSLLISQISEYSAIFLAHRLRRFDVEIRLGLSDQLHPSKSYSREGRGLVSKYNLRQNHSESLSDLNTDIDVHDIKLSTTPTLEGYNIHRYVDVITSHTLIEEEELKRLHHINTANQDEDDDEDILLGEILEQFPQSETDDLSSEQFDLGLNEIYKELVVELRNEAYKIEANAVVGINFNITPLMIRSGNNTNVHYKITCSGNAVWIVDQQN